ncbi:hypothetical protein EYF80_065865 [Liparis tanakae]|uniref:Uncharacterized protein n=1 Tax=Liparis tanakae TaxID=230148 RepID=A0A4Z2E6P6_9TELE|nr:hypothetical protein EYF80_065865 [Liparis tanakae]
MLSFPFRNRLNSVVDVMGDFIGEAFRNADLVDEQGLVI